MSEKTFLVEIGTEELPPKALRNLAEAFASNMATQLDNNGITYDKIEWFATPRRLALKINNLSEFQLDYKIEKYGPMLSQAFDEKGKPSKAAESWANKCGVTIDQVMKLNTTRGERLFYSVYMKGKSSKMLLSNIIKNSLAQLPMNKLMSWGSYNTRFVRPVRTLTLLLGDEVIPSNIFNVTSNRIIRGHRFMGESEFIINNANHYPQILLERGKVIADYEQRKIKIKSKVEEEAYKIGGNADLSDDLLEEVTSLVEWPIVFTAKFEEKFLAIPPEALVYIMKNNQKYFPIYDNNGKLLPNFIFVSNIESKDSNQIISGNERVMHARLADAEFFFNTDRKKRLEDNLHGLNTVLFHQHIGTLRDKVDRIAELSSWIACEIGANSNHAKRAGMLSKCDLITNMVVEFTTTQGVVGMYYALKDGEDEDVAIALNEHYKPRFSGDSLPSNLVGCSVAIADKIDNIVGMLGIGQYPKGDKDPFALRRAALGILRIIIEKNLNLDIQILTEKAVSLYHDKLTNIKVIDEVIDFILRRFLAWYQDKNYAVNVIQAVLKCRPTRPIDFDARIKAVSSFSLMREEAYALTIANKRISNILAKVAEPLNNTICLSAFKEKIEIELARTILLLRDKLKLYLAERRYHEILIELAGLRDLIDVFFQKVIVNTDDKAIRINRLTLLFKLRELFLQVADFSMLK